MWSLSKDLNLGVRFVYRVVYWSPAAEVVKDTYLNEKDIKVFPLNDEFGTHFVFSCVNYWE